MRPTRGGGRLRRQPDQRADGVTSLLAAGSSMLGIAFGVLLGLAVGAFLGLGSGVSMRAAP